MSEARIAAIVLAAGESKRWGEGNKLLAPVAGIPMLRRTVEAVAAAGIRDLIVATGHQWRQVRASLKGLSVAFAHAPDFAHGMAGSLRAGIGAVPADCAGALICLGDMPFVLPETFRLLAATYDPRGPWMALVPTWEDRRGNPVLIGRPLFREIMRLTGDQGARGLLAAIPERVLEVPCGDSGVLRDLDRPGALLE
jgi:molybdenum cofactor cytidylyltransferase